MKYGGKAAKGTGKAVLATGKNVGEAALHPSQTLRGAGQAVKTAAVGGAIGYVGWEKLTTDKSVVRIVRMRSSENRPRMPWQIPPRMYGD